MSDAQPLDELYFMWLYGQVADPDAEDPSLTYWKILKKLFTTEFTWIVPNDDNRREDGKALRSEFIDDADLSRRTLDREWLTIGCSMLELMIAMSRKIAFEAEGTDHYWFWHLMENLGLNKYNDSRRFSEKRVDDILDRVIQRTYKSNGEGGFFPLKETRNDQRDVELWYQISEYVLERS